MSFRSCPVHDDRRHRSQRWKLPDRRGWAEWLDGHSGRIMVMPAVIVLLVLRDLSADHLGLSGAVALRALAGRLHAEIHRPGEFPQAADRLAAIPPARHVRRLRLRPVGRCWRWSRPGWSSCSPAISCAAGPTILGTHRPAAHRRRWRWAWPSLAACHHWRRAACREPSSTRFSTWSSASPCSSRWGSAWRCCAASRSAAATSFACCSSSR